MKILNLLKRFILLLIVVLLCLVSIRSYLTGNLSKSTRESKNSLVLKPPTFLDTAHASAKPQSNELSISLNDAGVIAYVFVSAGIDLDEIPSRLFYDQSEERAEKFVKGVIKPTNYGILPKIDSAARPYIVLHQDGWVIAYLEKNQPASALFDWANFHNDNRERTSLERILERAMAGINSFSPNEISYYDFRYPDATKLLLVADYTNPTKTTESFSINIPNNVFIYEWSWSNSVFDLDGGNPITAVCRMNGNSQFSKVQPIGTNIGDASHALGLFDEKDYEGSDHSFELENLSGQRGNNYCGIAIVYSD